MRGGWRLAFPKTDAPNPHLARGRELLRSHPELRRYLRPYPATGAWILAVVALQLGLAMALREVGWPWVPVVAWLVGAFASHALFVLLHEAAHDLIATSPTGNRLWGMLCNVGQGFPSAMAFRRFHRLHHSHLDEYDHDADLAFHGEALWVGRSPLRKALWLALFPVIEVLRPLRVRPRRVDAWIVANLVLVLASDAAVAWIAGWNGLAYLLCSTLFGVGLHPVGARWIQEHYTFRAGQETNSYYGPLNRIAYNIGNHHEHHDLERIPWVHLPKLKAAAPELYDGLFAHRSWTRLLLRFLFDRELDLFSRITRERRPPSVETRLVAPR